jgi:hypothetical protein
MSYRTYFSPANKKRGETKAPPRLILLSAAAY